MKAKITLIGDNGKEISTVTLDDVVAWSQVTQADPYQPKPPGQKEYITGINGMKFFAFSGIPKSVIL